MLDEIIKQIFKSTGNLAWLCILILFIFQFFYQYIFNKISQNMISISKNECKYVKKRYEIYKVLYFKLVKNIEDNSDINISENENARKYLQSFCKFNIKRYNDTFCYLSDDLLMCLYEYNSKKSNQSLKKIQRKITSEFDDMKKKMGLPYKGKALKYSTIAMYSFFYPSNIAYANFFINILYKFKLEKHIFLFSCRRDIVWHYYNNSW